VAPPLATIANFAVNGYRPVGTDVIVRVQFVPSPERATRTPMTRGGDEVGTATRRPTNTAATPARTTRNTITRTTTTTVRFPVERGGGGDHIGGYGVGIVAGGIDVENGTPQFEQNWFTEEFGAPQRGQVTIAAVRCLRQPGARRTAANIFAETLMRS